VRNLGERRDFSSLQFLLFALHDPAWEVRVAAVWALREYGEQAPAQALLEALADEDGSVRAAALRVLAGVRGQIPPDRLAGLLNDTDELVREAAQLTFEELREQEPPGHLAARLHDEKAVEPASIQMPPEQAHADALPALLFTLGKAAPFKVLGDRYQLQESIGRGGMATIYRGWDLKMGRVVAIKVLRELYNTDAKFVARFQLEAKAASALRHPHIVQVYDYGQTDGTYYIIMEMVEGINLRRYLRGYGGVLDVDRAVIVAHDVALGLGAAHRRAMVHRDVKPQNILVSRDGSVKLTDFGIVSVYTESHARRLTTTGMTLGTVQYYAPEQAQGQIVSPAADVYSLGIVIYEMLTGRTPFDGNSLVAVAMQHIQDAPIPPSQLNPNIPAALEAIILRCLEKAPQMRFRDGSQLAQALVMLGDAPPGETAPGRTPMLATSHPIPSRPAHSGRDSTGQHIPPDAPASSPDNRMAHDDRSDQHDAGQVPGSLMNQTDSPDQQSFAPLPGSTASHQFRRRTVPRSGAVQPKQRNARFTGIFRILIPLAVVLLLGLSVYLAAGMSFVRFPFINGATPPPTVGPVPDLRGLAYQAALARARHAGFNVRSQDGTTMGVVIKQFPVAGDTALKNSTITVEMGSPASSPTPTTRKVPSHLVNNSVGAAEEILNAAHIPYIVQPAGTDPGKGSNIVTKVVPGERSPLQPGQYVRLYVVNFGIPVATPDPTAKPRSTPSPMPTPSPTPNPDPTPTP
jgi:eukaryotic-like serine/threonine-protein kinase